MRISEYWCENDKTNSRSTLVMTAGSSVNLPFSVSELSDGEDSPALVLEGDALASLGNNELTGLLKKLIFN